ncbi:MAG: anhydro-N-acetylmuramic acid kinase [Candidatus Methanomethylicota archaeon]|uniref:Anhydro-N-acetylmuramic acid kinase n=1 Tax=Thermoproteota archaeon TaxID=2056631 RepID=A0A497F7F5_9CREN|nr:MAG: anhydro-N-acetylmuramic acid kinase [Candidatus Verstraetearchaeota archaeon]
MDPIEELVKLRRKKRKTAIGLMSGTSADGVSAVLVEVEGNWIDTKFKIIGYKTYTYPQEVRRKIFELFKPETGTVDKICAMNFVLGKIFAEAALKIAEECGISIKEVDFIASHGQTIHHLPGKNRIGKYEVKSTLQIGEPSVIAYETGVLTIADFRPKDVAAGGEGAPISAYADYVIFRSSEISRAIQNIGGIANVTYLPRNAEISEVIAFDTGPGNMLIDAMVKYVTGGKLRYDVNGEIAANGRVSEELLNWLMEHPFIRRRPPKTTGREEFGEKFALKVIEKAREYGVEGANLVATVTRYTTKTIAESYRKYLPKMPDEVIVGGGGSHNKTLMRMLKEELGEVKILTHEDFGIPAQAKEPLVMVILANEVIHGHFNNIPNATGASKKVIMGKIVFGS